MSAGAAASSIRLRVCVAVVVDKRILLVPHYETDRGPVQWNLPGGRLAFGECLREGAEREFLEETGLRVAVEEVLDVSEVVRAEPAWHSVSIIFSGRITGGAIASERGHRYGEKTPCWFTAEELSPVPYHPRAAIDKALGLGAGEP